MKTHNYSSRFLYDFYMITYYILEFLDGFITGDMKFEMPYSKKLMIYYLSICTINNKEEIKEKYKNILKEFGNLIYE